MKPVRKGARPRKYAAHGDAKPDLVARLGPFCSYCESAAGRLQNLDVEHIYSQKGHLGRSRNWSNFLLACSSCNTYKSKHLGHGRLLRLLKRCYWPHLDNTFNAFDYHPDGRVTIKAGAGRLAKELMDMAGLLISPAVTRNYEELGLAYDGISVREKAWNGAVAYKQAYDQNPTPAMERITVIGAVATGFFSIWMHVFRDVPRMRLLFIDAFQADPACFNAETTAPVLKGRI